MFSMCDFQFSYRPILRTMGGGAISSLWIYCSQSFDNTLIRNNAYWTGSLPCFAVNGKIMMMSKSISTHVQIWNGRVTTSHRHSRMPYSRVVTLPYKSAKHSTTEHIPEKLYTRLGLTAIPRWIHRFSSDHPTSNNTWPGQYLDMLGTPVAVAFLLFSSGSHRTRPGRCNVATGAKTPRPNKANNRRTLLRKTQENNVDTYRESCNSVHRKCSGLCKSCLLYTSRCV